MYQKFLICLVFIFITLGSFAQNKSQSTNLFNLGAPVSSNEENLENFLENFPLYIENAQTVALVDYNYVGLIENREQARNYAKANFNGPLFAVSKEIIEEDQKLIFLFLEDESADRDALLKDADNYADEYIKNGYQVYAINYVYEMETYTYYVFINPETHQVVTCKNMFGFDVLTEHLAVLANIREGALRATSAIMAGEIEKAISFMINIANNDNYGYDQTYRWAEARSAYPGKYSYDCSSLVITAWQQAGVPVKTAGATYTGNMRSVFLGQGFQDVTSSVTLSSGSGTKRGDVLLNTTHHTAMVVNNNASGSNGIVHASINEKGTATGGVPGDQTGKEICTRTYYNYPWNYVLRYKESTPPITLPSTSVSLPNGTYYIRSKISGKGVEVPGGDNSTGAKLRLWDANTATCQRWSFTRQSDNTYQIINIQSGKVLDVPSSSLDVVQLQQWTDNGGQASQRWYVVDCGRGYVKIISKVSGKAMDIDHSGTANGTVVQQYADNGGDSQQFWLESVNLPEASVSLPNGVYYIRNKISGKDVEVPGGNNNNGAKLRLWDANTETCQQWMFTRQSNNTYQITNVQSGKMLDVPSSSLAVVQLQQWSDNGGESSQRWYVVDCGSGYVKIVSRLTGQCVDVYHSGTENGTVIQQYPDNGGDAQRFRLVPVNLPETSIELPDDVYYIRNKISGKGVEVPGDDNNNGAKLRLWDANAETCQQWTFTRQSDNTYQITNVQSGKMLDVPSSSLAVVQLQQWSDNGGQASQRWYVVDCGDGYVNIVSKLTGQCVDVYHSGTENGTVIQQYPGNDGDAQKFRLLSTMQPTKIQDVASANIQAWVNAGTLYVSGLVEGKAWKLYSVSGILVKQGIAGKDVVAISLELPGVYIIQSEDHTSKIVYI